MRMVPYPLSRAEFGQGAYLSVAISRGLPIKRGWNNTAAKRVQSSDRAKSSPMLAVPGWLENHRLPNAVAVVSALKNTARVRLVCRRWVCPARQAMM